MSWIKGEFQLIVNMKHFLFLTQHNYALALKNVAVVRDFITFSFSPTRGCDLRKKKSSKSFYIFLINRFYPSDCI